MRRWRAGCTRRSRRSCTSACWRWQATVRPTARARAPSSATAGACLVSGLPGSARAAHHSTLCCLAAGDGNLEGDLAEDVDPDNLSYEVRRRPATAQHAPLCVHRAALSRAP